jgi:hypothetical protein
MRYFICAIFCALAYVSPSLAQSGPSGRPCTHGGAPGVFDQSGKCILDPFPSPGTFELPPLRASPRTDVDLANAKAFQLFLGDTNGLDIICHAIGNHFVTNIPQSGCTGPIVNVKKTVVYEITTIDGALQIFELEIRGESTELALKMPQWVERHRFYVAFGFNALLRPSVTVANFEPMLKTTPGLFPVQEQLFEYIRRDRDPLLRPFQESIKGSISQALQVAFRNHAEAK